MGKVPLHERRVFDIDRIMRKHWIIEPDWAEADGVAERWGVPRLIAQLLYNRGFPPDDDPHQFIHPRLKDLCLPDRLPNIDGAAGVVVEAVEAGRSIVIYGDYDVDGITGVATLWRVLSQAGAKVSFHVPERTREGYGLHVQSVERLADDGAELIISVDCGVSDAQAAQALKRRGVSLIITDHHTLPGVLPEAAAIVHPRLNEDYPNPDLCGSGVAFKLAWAVAQRLSGSSRVAPELKETLTACMPLVALGTIADVVPLVGENRIIAKHGLAALARTKIPGLIALLESAGLRGADVGGYDVGFKLAPRLNAAGRMGHARLAIELLTRATYERAQEITRYLDSENRNRQKIERHIFEQACEKIERDNMACESRRAIVVAGDDWHAGVIGIVAARLVDRYGRPAVVISLSEGRGMGSGRGLDSFHLHEALAGCGRHLTSFGGHAMAAGLRIDRDKVEVFREAFVELANNRLTAKDLVPRLRLDGSARIHDLSLEMIEWINAMEPFGQGNPKPRFATDWIELADEPRCVGQDGTHLQATFRQNGTLVRSIGFGLASRIEDLKEHRRCRVAFEPQINDYRGQRLVQMRLIDLKFPNDPL